MNLLDLIFEDGENPFKEQEPHTPVVPPEPTQPTSKVTPLRVMPRLPEARPQGELSLWSLLFDDEKYPRDANQPASSFVPQGKEEPAPREVEKPVEGHGWVALYWLVPPRGAAPAVPRQDAGFSYLTRLVLLLIPMLAFAGYYQYAQVKAARGIVGNTTVGICGAGPVLDVDGNKYNIVQIGTQCWLDRNMNVGTRINVASNQTNNATIEKWCYGDSDANCTANNPNRPDGGLYQWNEAMQYSTTEGAQGICPSGWHIPTDAEWYTLENFLKDSGQTCSASRFGYGCASSGTKLKPRGTTGFNGNLAGYGSSGSTDYRDWYGYWWSSSESGANAQNRQLAFNAQVSRSPSDKTVGFSVRCVKDSQQEPSQVTINTTPTFEGSTLDNGLVGHWTFDGPDIAWSSTTAEVSDASGNRKMGDVNNILSSAVRTGKMGQALLFDGVDDWMTVGTDLSSSITTGFTFCTWAFMRSWGAIDAVDQDILVRVGASNLTANYVLEFDNLPVDGGLHKDLQFGVEAGGNEVTYSGTGSIVDLNEWNHICATHKNSPNESKIFINGSVVTTSGSTNSLSGDADDTYIGGRSGTVGAEDHADAILDDVRIYNRALNADEVRELYDGTLGNTMGICGAGPVLDADGNKYNIVQIGTQCWLDRNMNVGTRINVASAQTNNATAEKWCYSNTDSNCTDNHPNRPDGGLYQWNEAMQYSTTEGAQGICPSGWHIPTDAEWYTLENFLKDNGQTCSASRSGTYDCASAGTKLKPGGSTNFSGNLAGDGFAGASEYRGAEGNWWSSSASGGSAWLRTVASDAQVARYLFGKTYGLSVRCIKD